ncbi:TPA: hypothetical protein ACIZEL_003003, partial [Enterococcus faecium]
AATVLFYFTQKTPEMTENRPFLVFFIDLCHSLLFHIDEWLIYFLYLHLNRYYLLPEKFF